MAYKNRAKANLGMELERIIDMANNKYRNAAYKDFETMAKEVKSKDGYSLHYLEAA